MKTLVKIIALSGWMMGQGAFAAGGSQEPIMGHVTDEVGIVFQVQSGGCTDRKSFFVQQTRLDGVRVLRLVRVRPDTCLALFPHGIKFRIPYDELGIQARENFRIDNEFSLLSR